MNLKISKDAQFIGEAIVLAAFILKDGYKDDLFLDDKRSPLLEAMEYLKQGYEVGEEVSE